MASRVPTITTTAGNKSTWPVNIWRGSGVYGEEWTITGKGSRFDVYVFPPATTGIELRPGLTVSVGNNYLVVVANWKRCGSLPPDVIGPQVQEHLDIENATDAATLAAGLRAVFRVLGEQRNIRTGRVP